MPADLHPPGVMGSYRTVEDVAAEFGLHPRRVHRAIRKYAIPVLRDGRLVRFDAVAVEALQEALRAGDKARPPSPSYTQVLASMEAMLLEEKRKRARPSTKGFVYFIQSNGPDQAIKIGYSVKPQERRSELQVGHPYPLRVIAIQRGTMTDEDRLKLRFLEYRMTGEWHRPGKRLMAHIKRLASYCAAGSADG